jgi:hypothetical protein
VTANILLLICEVTGGIGWALQILVWFRHPGSEDRARAECWLAVVFGAASASGLGWALLVHNHAMAAWTGCCLVCSIWSWIHWNRKRRKRGALAAMGAKSRALVAALVRKVRESATPRPVLRPVPGGAG